MFASRYVILVLAIATGLMSQEVPAQPSQWFSRGPGAGGALFLASLSPHAASEMFVSCDMSQVFHTTDGAATWSILDYRQLQGGNIAGRVSFTSDPQILYALNGANDQNRPARSTDGGLTWAFLASDPTSGGAYSFYADPTSTTRMLLSDYSHLYYSSNGGASFSQKFTANVNGGGCHVAGVFFDGSTIYVGTNAGLLTSTDGGATFAVSNIGGMQQDEVMLSFAGAKQGQTIRFFCIVMNSADVYGGITGADYAGYKNIYTLDAGQPNWTARGAGIPAGTFPFFVSMARNNIDVAYVAGGSNSSAPIVFKTTNGGTAWQNVFVTSNNQNIATGWSGAGGDRGWSYGEYALGFAVAPLDANVAIITDLGCAHVTTSGGTTWRQAYVAVQDQNPPAAPTPTGKNYHGIGFENTSCWSLHWSDTANLFVGQTDIRGARSSDGGLTWSFGYTGHTLNSMYRIVKHPASATIYAATSSIHDMYESTYLTDARINPNGARGQVLASTDKGHSWTLVHEFPYPVIWVEPDRTDANRLYANVIHPTQGGIYVTNNLQGGPTSTWTRLGAPSRTEGHPYNLRLLDDGTLVATYSGRRAGTPLAFTPSSGVFISTNGGASWIDRSSPSMFFWTKDVVVDPFDASQNIWYCGVASGWGGPPNGLGGLYKTTDRGVTWNKILSLDHVESCTIRPDSPNEMYVTSETEGLWYSSTRNNSTPAFVNVASYKFRHPHRVFFNPFNSNEVWVTSFGGGLFVGTALKVPVAMQSFTARREENTVRLEWSTASEMNNAGFDVERNVGESAFPGREGIGWSRIGFVSGAGTSSSMRRYCFTDLLSDPLEPVRYRLRQIDLDGSYSYSSTIELKAAQALPTDDVVLYPNPVAAGTTMHVRVRSSTQVKLDIIDALGRTVTTVMPAQKREEGAHSASISTVSLHPGNYWCRLHADGRILLRRFLVIQ